jgi:hypothetical protein
VAESSSAVSPMSAWRETDWAFVRDKKTGHGEGSRGRFLS